jgi:putative ABC transport system substrate-binding protein
VARAQQTATPVIGFLRSTTAAPFANLPVAFHQGLSEAGLIEGKNVRTVYRYADNQSESLPDLAAGLVRLPVALIVVNQGAVYAAKAATSIVPIVFVGGGDPVKVGLVASLNRPGGNITGVSFLGSLLGGKRLELLRQVVPSATKIGVLIYPGTPTTEAERADLQSAANAIGQQLVVADVRKEGDIEPAISSIVQRGGRALLVGAGAFLNSYRGRIIALAARYRLPGSYNLRDFVADGGLMSYGPGIADAYRQAGIYAGRILKGEKPADLPVIQSPKFEFVINLKTAKTLGLELHPQLLATADKVIE